MSRADGPAQFVRVLIRRAVPCLWLCFDAEGKIDITSDRAAAVVLPKQTAQTLVEHMSQAFAGIETEPATFDEWIETAPVCEGAIRWPKNHPGILPAYGVEFGTDKHYRPAQPSPELPPKGLAAGITFGPNTIFPFSNRSP